jgi:hypothetical protein
MARLTPEQLEQQIHAVLRSQPPRRAPRGLENRVLTEIARRRALPWWQQSFAHWPIAMRVAFLVSTLVLVGLAVPATAHAVGMISGAEHAAALQPMRDLITSVQAAGAALMAVVGRFMPSTTISSTWIYAGVAALGVLHLTLLGLGATAYRFIWQRR